MDINENWKICKANSDKVRNYDFSHLSVKPSIFSPEEHGSMVAQVFLDEMERKKMTETPEKSEAINHPNHYLGSRKYEPIDVINDWELNFQTGNAVKYISRAGRKNKDKTVEDLKKAVWYLEWEISNLLKE